ncbi:MAG: hypothetical protein K8M05_10085 [Deltaproteobacteria bacterium]|nr:hypothetical protein [Kofleriaceae bacterium]
MTSRGIGALAPAVVTCLSLSLSLAVAACGGKAKPPPPPPEPVVKKAPPPPPPPVCVPPLEPAMVGMATADDGAASFCVSDGAEQSACFAVDLASKKYAKLDEPPVPQHATLAAPVARLVPSATDVKVCTGEGDDTCKTLKPRVPKGATEPIEAAVDATGAWAVLMLGDTGRGRGVAEVWDVAKARKTATIKYAKGDHRCGTPQVLGDVVYISASVCAGPAAKGALYSTKGKKLADVGGKDFGTYGASAVQVTATQWAFLEEGAGAIALQDVKSGKVDKTIDLLSLWAGEGGGVERGGGNPGESALVRGGDGKLVVIAGSPVAGTVGVVDLTSGDTTVIPSLACEVEEKPATEAPTGGATETTEAVE